MLIYLNELKYLCYFKLITIKDIIVFRISFNRIMHSLNSLSFAFFVFYHQVSNSVKMETELY